MEVNEKIKSCRNLMKEKKIDAYIVPTADFHQSEYLSDFFKGREFLTGFTGSEGTFVLFKDEACLWVDGRYYLQAEKEILGTEIRLFKLGQANVPTYIEYIISKLKENSVLGFDEKLMLASDILDILAKKKFKIENFDPLEIVWKKRPKISNKKIFVLEDRYSGESYSQKIEKIRKKILELKVDYNIISTLDDIAWIYNIRGNDIESNPVAFAFSIISKDKSYLYIDKAKLTKESQNYFKDNSIEIKEYFQIFEDIKKLKGNILIDFNASSYQIYNSIDKKNKVINSLNPSTYIKACKNEVEIENTREIHIQDGVAITKFMYWLKNSYKVEEITEISAAAKINSLRKEIIGYLDTSFETISAFGKNAAIVHYNATEKSNAKIKDGVFLLDSGGQYLKGTTDITRTFFLGKVAKEKKVHNTLVLKGMLALSRAKFLSGVTGTNLDVLARQFLWNETLDYKHGTGHGVGHILNVHEGPQGIRMQYNSQKLEEGMIVSNEPGVYIENSHGIRIENELLIKKFAENENGKFLEFETLTYAPIDLDGIVKSMLTLQEKIQLNQYHKEVFEKLSPFLNKKEKAFLKEYTKII